MSPTIARTRTLTLVAAAAAVGVLTSPAIPARADSAVVVIGQLEAEGFDVRVDRLGSAPLNRCEVTSIRNPQTQTRLVRVDRRGERDVFVPVIVNRTITVSLDCSR